MSIEQEVGMPKAKRGDVAGDIAGLWILDISCLDVCAWVVWSVEVLFLFIG